MVARPSAGTSPLDFRGRAPPGGSWLGKYPGDLLLEDSESTKTSGESEGEIDGIGYIMEGAIGIIPYMGMGEGIMPAGDAIPGLLALCNTFCRSVLPRISGIFVCSGSSRSWSARSVSHELFPELCIVCCWSTPRDWSRFVSASVEPFARGFPKGSSMLPRSPES